MKMLKDLHISTTELTSEPENPEPLVTHLAVPKDTNKARRESKLDTTLNFAVKGLLLKHTRRNTVMGISAL